MFVGRNPVPKTFAVREVLLSELFVATVAGVLVGMGATFALKATREVGAGRVATWVVARTMGVM